MVYICKTILQKMNLEAGLEEVFACVAHAVFRSNAADVYVCSVKKLEDLSERLSCRVDALESGVLLYSLVASFVECELFACVWKQVGMDLSAAGTGYAVRRPCSSEFHE